MDYWELFRVGVMEQKAKIILTANQNEGKYHK